VKTQAGLGVHDVRVAYGSVTALDGVSLEVPPGEFMVLLGPSGCGKSTLLAAIAGLQDLDGGRVMLGGRDVTGLEPAERDIAFVFQSYALYPTMTVAENLTFGMRMRGIGRTERSRRLADVAHMLGLEPLLARRPAQLSGGQRQRVAIGRALVRDPALFLFDEPLSNLDASLRTEMRSEILHLQRHLGTTSVYVTHDQIEAMTMASRVGIMRSGQILQVGTPRTIYDRPETMFVARFVGSPGMNFIAGHLAHETGGVAFRMGDVALPLPAYLWADQPQDGRPVVLGIRPEDVGMPDEDRRFSLPATTILVQPTGAEILARVTFPGGELTARFHRDRGPAVGQPLHVGLDLRNASIFCPASERRL
jgi:multiple sugar transport system ATP-binding protein